MVIAKNSGSVNASRRQKQIEDCLYNNLLHRPYTSVSVSDLCHQMDISRIRTAASVQSSAESSSSAVWRSPPTDPRIPPWTKASPG